MTYPVLSSSTSPTRSTCTRLTRKPFPAAADLAALGTCLSAIRAVRPGTHLTRRPWWATICFRGASAADRQGQPRLQENCWSLRDGDSVRERGGPRAEGPVGRARRARAGAGPAESQSGQSRGQATQLADLRESGDLENTADSVLGLYRAEMDHPGSDDTATTTDSRS